MKDQGEEAEGRSPDQARLPRGRKQQPPVPHRYHYLSYPLVLAFSSRLVKPHTQG